MKKVIFILFIASIFFNKSFYAQHHAGRAGEIKGPRGRIEELEKIKLLEILDLNDKTMLQFFAKRKEYNDNLQKLEEEKNEKLDDIHEMIEHGAKDEEYKKVINDIINLDSRISKTKEDFITSLDGLLTNEQIAKYLLFDRNFRKEIRELILKNRKEID